MIAILGRLYPEGLSVIAQESMNRYKGTTKPIGQIGSELKADYVVKGGVRRDGDRVNITAQLIRAQDQAQIWRDSFERDLRQVMAVQVEIAQAVAQGIERIAANPQVEMALVRPLDPRAYEAYLRGDFDKAIELDPYYAPAYTASAGKMYLGALFGFRPPQTFTRVIDLASKAIGLDQHSLTRMRFWRWANFTPGSSGVRPRRVSAWPLSWTRETRRATRICAFPAVGKPGPGIGRRM